MKKIKMKASFYLMTLYLFISGNVRAQTPNFQGIWRGSTAKSEFILNLIQFKNTLSGSHTSIELNGNKIDSSLDDTDITIKGVVNPKLKQAVVTFTSSFNNSAGKAKITQVSTTEIKWMMIQKPAGEYYIPQEAILKKQ